MATLYVVDDYVAGDYIQTDITILWGNKEIFIPKFASVQIQTVPSEIRQLDLDVFRLALKNLEDSSDGMAFLRTHSHNTTVEVGGANLARVIQIINGYTVTFEDGMYAVNLVGANSNVGDVVNVNNVSVRSANSAGLQDLNSLQAASFGGGAVTINPASVFSGTTFPIGTRQFPINNTADALSIATTRGLREFSVPGSLTLSIVDFSSGFIFRGDNPIASNVMIQDGADVANCEFINIRVNGILDNFNKITLCDVEDITHINGIIKESGLRGTITLGGGIQASIVDCFNGFASASMLPIVDFGGSGQSLALRGFDGGMQITNCSDAASNSTLAFNAGSLIIDSTITAGTFTISGDCEVIDNSTGTAVIIDKTMNTAAQSVDITLSNVLSIVTQIRKYDTNRTLIDENAFTLTVYDDDGSTPLTVYDLKDRNGLASFVEIFERIPQ